MTDATDQKPMIGNPFDVFDEVQSSGTLEMGPRPSLADRFRVNAREGWRNSIFGAAADVVAPGEPSTRARNAAAWEAMPQWETPLEATASFAGQVAGGFASIENMIPTGFGAALVGKLGLRPTALGARMLAGATDAAIVNTATDPIVQGFQIAGGTREAYDPLQTALAAPVGAAVGGGIGAAGWAKSAFGPHLGLLLEEATVPAGRASSPEGAKSGRPAAPDAASADRLGKPAASPVDGAPTPSAAPMHDPASIDGAMPPRGEARTAPGDAPRTPPAENSKTPSSPPVEPSRAMLAERRVDPLPPTPERPDGVRAAAEDAVGRDAAIGDRLAAEAAIREGRPIRTTEPPTPKDTAPPAASPDLAMRAGPFAGEARRSAAGVAETAPDATPAAVRLRETADALITALDPAAVRQGRLPQVPGIQGVYKPASGVVRGKNSQDFSVLTHELGHHVEEAVGAPVKGWMAVNHDELVKLAYVGTASGMEQVEGFAEMVRLFVTNRAYLDNVAPGLSASFETMMGKEAPDLLAALGAAREAYGAWLGQPSARAVASTIVSAKRPGWWDKARDALGDVKGTFAEFFHTSYTRLIDDLHPLQRTVDELTRIWAEKHPGEKLDLKAVDDAYKLARMSRGAYSTGHADILFGVTPYHGTAPVSGSLRDALIAAQGGGNLFSSVREDVIAAFGSYLWSRRARGEWDRFTRGLIPNPPDKLTFGDHETNIAELEAAHPQFVDAAEKIYDWNRALWDKKLDAGLITEKQHADGLAIVDYVPGLRHFAETEAKTPSRGAGRSNKGAMVRQFLGSDRDVINPIDSLVADAYETAMSIARNDAIKALARLGDLAGNGAGRFVERIPRHDRKRIEISTDQVLESLAKEMGMSRRDAQTIADALADLAPGASLPETMGFHKQALTTERGEAIVWYREGGDLIPLRLADGKYGAEMVAAVNAMSRDEKAFFLNLLAKPAALLRAGVTSHPTFLVSNFVRDQMVTALLFGKPFERFASSVKGFADNVLGTEAARAYIRAGGLSGGANTATLREAQVGRDAAASMTTGAGHLLSVEGFSGLIEGAETASRLGNYGVFFKEARKRGLDDWEASFEAAYRARDVLDFDRRGSGTMAITRIIPFLNASVQGLDKAARVLGPGRKGLNALIPAAKRIAGEVLTAEEERDVSNAVAAYGRLAAATVFTMGLWALNSKRPDADEIDPRVRATHWVIPMGDGRWATVPKPFELAAVLNIGEWTWDAWAKSDPTARNRYLSGLLDVLTPPSLMEGNPLIKAAFELKANRNFFTGQDIVPQQMAALEPWLQYNHRTSALAKTLGAAADVSPLKIDHVITGFGGSWGRSLLAMSDWASGEKPATGWVEAIFTRRFVKDASRGSTSVGAFWDLVSQRSGRLEGANKTWKAMIDEGSLSQAGDWLGRQDDETRAYLAAANAPAIRVGGRLASVADVHPLVRARGAALAIGALMRDLSDDKVLTADGTASVNAVDRRRALDVLSDLKMAETRDAMVQIGAPGFDHRRAIDPEGYVRELEAISPDLYRALADRYRTARVLRRDLVEASWPALRAKLLSDGSGADVRDLVVPVHAAGHEYDGHRIAPRGKVAVPGAGGG